jgi:hypothetical protein
MRRRVREGSLRLLIRSWQKDNPSSFRNALCFAVDSRISFSISTVTFCDNLLYPILIRDRMRLHTIPAFISVVGGLLFGASGLILGPLAVTITIFLLRFWVTRIPEPQS